MLVAVAAGLAAGWVTRRVCRALAAWRVDAAGVACWLANAAAPTVDAVNAVATAGVTVCLLV